VTDPGPAELAGILAEIVPGPGGFGHRQHVQLAFIASRRYGTTRAPGLVAGWIRHLTAHAPHKYHATVTRAWAEIVARHVAGDPSVADFAVFVERHPALLDKRLLLRHYSSRALASPRAKAGWAEPDVVPFPWEVP
jgi:hypothetical protein